ncbi:SDR family NAD(P)-dependent oxidoreductase [Kordiimonas aquimaris]|uniref:SDR family NAD(P)-dependent oxidoreductase n=1 Tax=Kordiimonas aquimaris TaxID=707591 RepID=UPI0021D0592F|nr:SDR family oxidoreductase [Kordiimonas aquimaris]
MISFDGQTFLVTGASRGIGAAAASILLKAGANVVGSYATSPGALAVLAEEFGSDRIVAVQADLGENDAGFRLWNEAMDFKGNIDGLVNNAGIMPSTAHDTDNQTWTADWANVMAVNVQAVADLCKAAIMHFETMRRQNDTATGRIITVASRAAFRGDSSDAIHYAASKGAVVAMMRSIARAFAKDGIYAYLIAPGWVKTDMAAVAYEPGNEHMLKEIPIGDAAPPEEIGNMIAFLLSGLIDHATGATFDINGASYVR